MKNVHFLRFLHRNMQIQRAVKENAAVFVGRALSGGEERTRIQKTAALCLLPDEGLSIHKGENVIAIQARR